MSHVYIVDGTIASGKSTLLKGLAKHGYQVELEPIEKWTPMMRLFYQNPQLYAHEVNAMCLKDLAIRDSRWTNETTPVVLERSIHSSYHIFGKLSFESGLVSSNDMDILQQLYQSWSLLVPNTMETTFIFLDLDADTAIRRMEARKQSEVLASDKEYFYNLVKIYRSFYDGLEKLGHTVIRLDGNLREEQLVKIVLRTIGEKNYLK